VAAYEDTGTQPTEMYPPIADRLYRSLEEFHLAEDSGAAEILSDFIKAWVDPEAPWPTKSRDTATAKAALDEACFRLDQYIKSQRSS
jgi:hypothetical protein